MGIIIAISAAEASESAVEGLECAHVRISHECMKSRVHTVIEAQTGFS